MKFVSGKKHNEVLAELELCKTENQELKTQLEAGTGFSEEYKAELESGVQQLTEKVDAITAENEAHLQTIASLTQKNEELTAENAVLKTLPGANNTEAHKSSDSAESMSINDFIKANQGNHRACISYLRKNRTLTKKNK